jgi:hypothetical protein
MFAIRFAAFSPRMIAPAHTDQIDGNGPPVG